MLTTPRWLLVVATALLLGWAGGTWFARRGVDRALQENAAAIAKADTVVVIEQGRTDTVRTTVDRAVTRWRTDTLWRERTVTVNDTVFTLISQPRLASIDSTIRACALLSDRVLAERSACGEAIRVRDARIALLERRPWTSRLGCGVTYAAVASRGEVRHGPGVGCQVTLWP